ncbi:hypothetical protein Pcinc_012735 [Petrolisthes cinctipes]|uniref:RRM domain-containing protein n=1 Tax=Petrolisthes cinctipes TaxID=88211 RepID=A0AAE1G432_PETCI|nr:hypothetical protein Pcinc_012735 [Petrolisthes cinctipes]
MNDSIQVKIDGTECHQDRPPSENMLRKKIRNIEMQNQSQQQRLHQLEKLVLELQEFISQTSTSTKHPLHQPAISFARCENVYNSGGKNEHEHVLVDVDEYKDPCEVEAIKLLTNTEKVKDSSEVGSQDTASLMDEFDRKARENGLVYGMTPCHSIAESDDLAETREFDTSSDSICPIVSESPDEIVYSTPSPALITPSYQNNTENPNPLSRDPETAPQLCFTTPSLLTTEALEDVEAHQQHINNSNECSNNDHPVVDNTQSEPSYVNPVNNLLTKRGSPFSNLIASIRQLPVSQSKKNISSKGFWPVKSAQYRSSEQKGSEMYSPTGSVGSTSEAILRWSQSLSLPFLSPLTESHCSDQALTYDEDFYSDLMFNVAEKTDGEASEDEELVVDEVVSQSVAVPGVGGRRKRSDSFTSIAGPCVPTDLIFDTSVVKHEAEDSHGEMMEEQILTEIAEDIDGSFLIDENLLPKDLTSILTVENAILEGVEDPTDKEDEQIISPKDCEEENIRESENKKPSQVEGKGEVNLPAGSVILAVVNEAGSLVPFVDVETVPEKNPAVLEAGDVDSLLAQFEATEAVNKPGNSSIKQEKEKINDKSKLGSEKAKPLDSVTKTPSTSKKQHDLPSGRSSQISPTHQNIKDALPQEVIEKIKASNKRKSTQMLPAPLAVHKGRVVKKRETTAQRSKAHRSSSRQRKKEKEEKPTKLHVPPPVDHDYCCSTDEQKKNKYEGNCHGTNTTSNTSNSTNNNSTENDKDVYNKLPDYYTVISKQSAKKANMASVDSNDDGGKKDSGVESGDVSDSSVETEERKKEGKDPKNSLNQSETVVVSSIAEEEDIYNKLPAYMTDIVNAKPKEEPVEEEDSSAGKDTKENESSSSSSSSKVPELKKIKRKLNLSEYRQRIQSTQSSRCASPTASTIADSVSTLKVAELVQKMESSQVKQEENEQTPESKDSEVKQVDEDIEEGELKGETDPEDEQPKTLVNRENNNNCKQSQSVGGTSKTENIASKNSGFQGLTSCNMSSNPEACGTAASPWQYSPPRTKSRRWSSSSRSRSRTRSPKHSTSCRHRSSRGRRRRKGRSSHSSQSPRRSSWRRWSRSHSRSGSHSRSRSRSLSSSRSSSFASRSRSRSRSRSSRRRDRWSYSRRRSSHERRRSRSGSRSSWYSSSRVTRSRSPIWPLHSRPQLPRHSRPGVNENRTRQVEERRVIYIGRISDGTTKAELRQRFERHGSIVDISVHFREHGDNYGFITYKNREEAYRAVEHGNDDLTLPKYDLCFGGRRAFCKVQYSDLDAQDLEGDFHAGGAVGTSSLDFDSLLRAAMKRNTR